MLDVNVSCVPSSTSVNAILTGRTAQQGSGSVEILRVAAQGGASRESTGKLCVRQLLAGLPVSG